MYKTIIWDLDGTLLDTVHDIAFHMNGVLRSWGFPEHTARDYHKFLGHGGRFTLMRAVPRGIQLSEEQLEAGFQEFSKNYLRDSHSHTIPFAGVPGVLETLHKRGVSMAVLTNKPHDPAVTLAEHFFPDIPFTDVFGNHDDYAPKPDPVKVYHILDSLNHHKEEALFIGDSLVDIQTARNAGITSVGVTWGYGRPEDIRQADIVVNSPSEIADL